MLDKLRKKYLGQLSSNFSLVAFDIGARGGLKNDLDAISNCVNYTLFEPDITAHAAIKDSLKTQDWRATQVLPFALGEEIKEICINIYSKAGCSSKFLANGMGSTFSRGDYYNLVGEIRCNCTTIDDLIAEKLVESPDFLKIDVQGMELEVLKGSERALLSTISGIRLEVSFVQQYIDQPLFGDIDKFLQERGFVPMHWIEFHEWRRSTKVKYPKASKGSIPLSRGQMIHGDILYLIRPEFIATNTERLHSLALLAACYEQYDHALAAIQTSKLNDHKGIIDDNFIHFIEKLSKLSLVYRRYKKLLSLFKMKRA